MKIEANAKKKPVPYIYEYFNVYGYYTNPLNQTRSVMAHMFNAFTEALNASLCLPKFIFLIPDIDFPRSTLRDNFGMTLVFEDCLIYFVKQLEKYMHTRRQDLMARRLRAVAFKSRYIWLKMIARPSILNHPDETRDRCLSG